MVPVGGFEAGGEVLLKGDFGMDVTAGDGEVGGR